MSVMTEYSLLNTIMLQRKLKVKKETSETCLTDKEWQKRYQRLERKRVPKFNISNDLKRYKIDLEISTKILDQCVKSAEGNPIYLTKKQWNWLDHSIVDDAERQCICCKKAKPLPEIFITDDFCKECTDKGIDECPICYEFRPLSESVEGFMYTSVCKECKIEMDNFKDCSYIIPNSKWLMMMLEFIQESHDLEDRRPRPTRVLASTRECKSISMTKMQCHWLYNKFCFCADHPSPIAGGIPENYCRRGATYAKWGQSIDKYLELLKNELAFPSSTPLPSEEEWTKCTNGTKETFRCVGCDKRLEMRYMRMSMQLSADQRKWLKWRLEDEVKSQASYNISEDGRHDISTRFFLKLMNNVIKVLGTTPKNSMISFDPYTVDMLRTKFCERYIKEEPNTLKILDQGNLGKLDKDQFRREIHTDLEMLGILLEMIDKDVWPQAEKPLCYQCITMLYPAEWNLRSRKDKKELK